MIGELVQQWVFALRVCAPLVRAAEAAEDAADDVAEWFELSLLGRWGFALMAAIDIFFDGIDWLLRAIETFWEDC
jgi:hypothetical protein